MRGQPQSSDNVSYWVTIDRVSEYSSSAPVSPVSTASLQNVFGASHNCNEILENWNKKWFGPTKPSGQASNGDDIPSISERPFNQTRTFASSERTTSSARNYANPSNTGLYWSQSNPSTRRSQLMYAAAETPTGSQIEPMPVPASEKTTPIAAPAVGTWTQRQYRPSPPKNLQPERNVPQIEKAVGEKARDEMQDAVWRWRFTRRWQAEQTRIPEPVPSCPSSKNFEQTLQYVEAMDGLDGCNLQLAHTSLRDMSMLDGNSSGQQSQSGNFLDNSISSSLSESFAPGGGMVATRELVQTNKEAIRILHQQMQLQQQAGQRMRNSMDFWLGTLLDTLEIDDWGTFKFLVLKVQGAGGRHKMLLRGRNYSSAANIIEELNRKVMVLCEERSVPSENIVTMGGGTMDWRRDRMKTLNLHSGFVSDAGLAGRPGAVEELMRLAAALTQQNLPPGYKVTIISD